MLRTFVILFILISATPNIYPQRVVLVDSLFEINEMNQNWQFIEVYNDKDINIKKVKQWKTINKLPITFSTKAKYVWVKTILYNSTTKPFPIRIFTKGIDNLSVYCTDGSLKDYTYQTGKNVPISERFVASQFLVIPIYLKAKSSTQVYIRLYNQSYQLSLPYLKVASIKYTNQFIKTGELGYTIYFGGLLLMIVFTVILFAFFKERLYLFYLFCLIGSFIMAGIYNDYHYIFLEKSPEFIKNKNVFAVITSLLNIFYLLFSEQYLKVDTRKNSWIIRISRYVICVLLMILIGFIVAGKELYHFRDYFYPLFSINVMIMNYYLLKSIQKKYSPSWYFLIATTPITLVSILEITSDYNGVPVQTMHDLYYMGTFIEMFFLTIGIVFRFRLEKTTLENLQQELFVAEIKAQDRERERIARDLHDNIGASIVGIQLRLSAFAEKYFNGKESPDDFEKTIQYLAQTSSDVRGLSHELTPPILTNLGLVEQIKEKYGFIANPIFKLSMPAEALVLDPFVELTLYKIINEAVQNILKHAKATEVGIELTYEKKTLKLRIEDNGIGFDLYQRKSNGMGLNNLRFRAESQLKGTLSIESTPGHGTIILVKVNTKAIPKNA